jgi:hypothetical protein
MDAKQITAQANHAACLLSLVMRDCDHCKFQPAEIAPWDEIKDIVTVTKEQTYQEFQSLAEKYAPKPMTARNAPETCNHRRAYRTGDDVSCPDCQIILDPQSETAQFIKRIQRANRDSGYVNYGMR